MLYDWKLRLVHYSKLALSLLMFFHANRTVQSIEVLFQELEYLGFVFRIRIAAQVVAFCLKNVEAYVTEGYEIRVNPVSPPAKHIVFPLDSMPPLQRLPLQMKGKVFFQIRVKLFLENFVEKIQLHWRTAAFQGVVSISNQQWDIVW